MSEALVGAKAAPGQAGAVRKFADWFPGVLAECEKISKASRWYNLEKMTPELAKIFVQQLSLWTRSAFKVRGHVIAICPHADLRLTLMEVMGEEDVEDPRIGMNHRQLMAKSLGQASGQSIADLEKVQPLPTTLLTFDTLFNIATRSWVEGVAFTSGTERVMRETGYFRLDAHRFQRDLGWSDEALAWFTDHDVADEEHGALIEQLDKYITDDTDWDRAEEALLQSWTAWWIMLDGCLTAHEQGLKPVKGLTCKALSYYY